MIEQVDDKKFPGQRGHFGVRYVLPKWFKPQKNLSTLLTTRVLVNWFSVCEDTFVFMYI